MLRSEPPFELPWGEVQGFELSAAPRPPMPRRGSILPNPSDYVFLGKRDRAYRGWSQTCCIMGEMQIANSFHLNTGQPSRNYRQGNAFQIKSFV